MRDSYSNGETTEEKWATKIAVLLGDGEWETDLCCQPGWTLFARFWRRVSIANRTGYNVQTADNCVRAYIHQSWPAARFVRCLVCFASLSTSQLFDQLTMHHGEKKQPVTTGSGKCLESFSSVSESKVVAPSARFDVYRSFFHRPPSTVSSLGTRIFLTVRIVWNSTFINSKMISGLMNTLPLTGW